MLSAIEEPVRPQRSTTKTVLEKVKQTERELGSGEIWFGYDAEQYAALKKMPENCT